MIDLKLIVMQKSTTLGFIGFVIVFLMLLAGLAGCNQDKTAPVITILGDNPHVQCLGIPYEDAGATANDDEDGNITGKISTAVNVDVETEGTYTVLYTVEDNAGNYSEKERIVQVIYCK